MRPDATTPSVTAGLMCQPETEPMPYGIPISARPNAKLMPVRPISPSAITAAPQPNSTSVNVPINSASGFLMICPFVIFVRADITV